MKRMSHNPTHITLSINGEAMQASLGSTLADLVARMELDIRKLAIERNLEIVPRSQYAATILQAGDRLEIVHFVGGG